MRKSRLSFVSWSIIVSTNLVVGLTPFNNTYVKAEAGQRFSCENIQGIPTTLVNTVQGHKKFINWDSTYFVPSGYTPEKRCLQVTNRLNIFFNQMSDQYIATGTINKLPVVCITQGSGKPCESLLYTLKPGQDGEAAVNLLISQTKSNFNEPPLREGPCHTYLSLGSLINGKPTAKKVCS